MKKICFITTVSLTVNSFLIEVIEQLCEGNYEVSIITDSSTGPINLQHSNLTIYHVEMSRGVSLTAIKSFKNIFRIMRNEKFDLVQYSTPNASLYASISSFILGVPCRVYAQWGIYYQSKKGLRRLIFKNLEKLICYFSSHVRPDSLGNLKFSIEEKLYPVDKGKVRGFGSASGVDLERFYPRSSSTELYKDKFVIGYVGRVNSDKGINELIESFKYLSNYLSNLFLLIVGDKEIDKSDRRLKENYDWAIKQSNVYFTGKVKNVEKFYPLMDVFVLPSHREGFGTVLLEAGACKVPIITTNIPGPSDLIYHMENGFLIQPYSVSELIDTLSYIYKNMDVAKEKALKNYQIIQKRFNQDYVAFEHVRDIKSLIEGKE